MPGPDIEKKNMGIALGLVLGVVWFLWSFHTETLLLTFGLISVFICVFMSRSLQIVDDEGQPVNLRLVAYVPWLIKEIVVANVDVIKRILHFGPIDEAISLTWIKVPAKQKTRFGRVLFANSITLTPGTISVEICDDDGVEQKFILVNAISSDGASSLEEGGVMGQKVSDTEVG